MKPYPLATLLFSIACFISTGAINAQDSTGNAGVIPVKMVTDPEKRNQLFSLTGELVFSLTTDLRAVLKDRGEKPVAHPARLIYANGQQPDTLPVTLKVRGNFRRSRVNCAFPPLLVDLPKKRVKKTLFAHQNKLKLVTHCQNDEWVVREYLVYKLYNLLTDLSFRTQPARVTYVDSVGKRASETHPAFLLEDEADVAKRNGMTLNNTRQIAMGYADSLSMATVAVFEYMIGNTDWSVPYRHNIRLFDNGTSGALPVPYDFDHAGIVDAAYARPAEQLGLVSVRERVYRGPAYPMPLLQRVFDRFNQLKPRFYALYQDNNQLNRTYIKRTLQYLNEFYTLINKPASVHLVFGQGAENGVGVKGKK